MIRSADPVIGAKGGGGRRAEGVAPCAAAPCAADRAVPESVARAGDTLGTACALMG